MNNRFQQQQQPPSALQQFMALPAYTIAVHTGLFALGVFVIQSPIAEMLVPEL